MIALLFLVILPCFHGKSTHSLDGNQKYDVLVYAANAAGVGAAVTASVLIDTFRQRTLLYFAYSNSAQHGNSAALFDTLLLCVSL